VEDDIDVWRYAILSCMPETMMTTTHKLPVLLSLDVCFQSCLLMDG